MRNDIFHMCLVYCLSILTTSQIWIAFFRCKTKPQSNLAASCAKAQKFQVFPMQLWCLDGFLTCFLCACKPCLTSVR